MAGRLADVLDLQARLVDKSLVLLEAEAGPNAMRYRMLETVHEYAAEKLAEGQEVAAARQSHAAYFSALARDAEPHLSDPSREVWLERLAADDENLRAALAYLREDGQAGQALSLAGALWRFWEVRGHFAEGRAQLGELLEQAGAAASPPERAKALLGAGAMAYYQGDYAWAGARYAEALDLFRGLDDRAGVAWTLIYQGWLANERGDFAAARALLGESLAIARALGDRQAIGWSLARLAMAAAFQEDYAAAQGYLDECVPILRQLGDKLGLAWALHQLGLVLMQLGDFEAAQAAEEESIRPLPRAGRSPRPGLRPRHARLRVPQAGPGAGGATVDEGGSRPPFASWETSGVRSWPYRGWPSSPPCSPSPSSPSVWRPRPRCNSRAIGGVVPAGLPVLLEQVVGGARQALGERAAAIQAEGSALTLDEAGALALELV